MARLSYDQNLTRVRILIRETRARPRYGTAMRSYALVLGNRQQIRRQIHDHIVGHLHHDKPTDDLRAAWEAIDSGQNEAMAGAVVYRVESNAHPVPLTTTDYREGTREELLAELEQARADRAAQGRADRVAQYEEAIAELQAGAACTSLPRTVYLVAQPGD